MNESGLKVCSLQVVIHIVVMLNFLLTALDRLHFEWPQDEHVGGDEHIMLQYLL
jgi:hypothetical protein